MADPGSELRRGMRELVGSRPRVRDDSPPSYAELRRYYGSNARIADAAGIPTGAQAAKAYREARTRPRKDVERRIAEGARRRRSSFLRSLERYQRGENQPGRQRGGRAGTINRLVLEERERRVLTVDIVGVAEAFRRYGVTIYGWIDYRTSANTQDVNQPVAFTPNDRFVRFVSLGRWDQAAEEFFDGWGEAFIETTVNVDEVDDLQLVIGYQTGAWHGLHNKIA